MQIARSGIASTEDDPFWLARLSPTSNGLPVDVWAMVGDGDRSSPRLLVGAEARATVALSPEPHLLAGDLDPVVQRVVIAWIERHLPALLRHWHGEIDSLDLAKKIVAAVGSR